MNKVSMTAYLVEELPKSLQPFFKGSLVADFDKVKAVIVQMAPQLVCVDMMHSKGTTLTAIDGYVLGSTRGYESLSAICQEFLKGIEPRKNGSYIIEMYYAITPFFPSLVTGTLDVETMAKELLVVHKHCVDSYLALIDAQRREEA